ncbi:unnamed protein product [Angiostrongylus costaricensis]|uniref:Anoctamin n=1 Tax=Angiostrongylus costaricensis TaxID=334426 RepID=A0A158PGC0_ANGCS|nr:unnamed protein product [Angiostrongylus costaricensis]
MRLNKVYGTKNGGDFSFQVGTEDVLRWSPVVWLLGVCVAGTFMNLIFYCQKKYRERKRRQQDQQDLLYSLAIPRSYPCLAPPPHLDCCRSSQISIPNRGLPSYEDVVTHKFEVSFIFMISEISFLIVKVRRASNHLQTMLNEVESMARPSSTDHRRELYIYISYTIENM